MYKIILCLSLLIIFLVSCKTKKGPFIKYNSNTINLGEIKFKKEFLGKIIIYNIGDEPMVLTQATADCSCTVPDDIKGKIVKPSDSAYINFKITPAIDGFLQQNIYLDNTSINENRVLFLIRANVKLINE